jgi:hypothetical protein
MDNEGFMMRAEPQERFQRFRSRPVHPSGSGLFGFWLRFRSVWLPKPGQSVSQNKDVPLRGKQCQKPKILPLRGYSILLTALMADFRVTRFFMRNGMKANKLDQLVARNSPPKSASARVFSRRNKICKSGRETKETPHLRFTDYDEHASGNLKTGAVGFRSIFYGSGRCGFWAKKPTQIRGRVGFVGFCVGFVGFFGCFGKLPPWAVERKGLDYLLAVGAGKRHYFRPVRVCGRETLQAVEGGWISKIVGFVRLQWLPKPATS